ncbi:hypothetical protein FHP25_25670 [Vineibacter terrae]|uniref:Uncharacterized protein n=1 Tax=Vineibacter terrae TaxID=2586908 RepID=A0A5C8PF80_9HYPH|nr:hypothetical protein [Vineibacter terrae]TXL72434.1 hypothetical protein FHP25_25670 [Vineibacter terrae]
MFRGPQATLLDYEVGSEACVAARRSLQIRRVVQGGDLKDDGGHIGAVCDLDPGDWVLVRPDGYVGAIVSADQAAARDGLLARIGLLPA